MYRSTPLPCPRGCSNRLHKATGPVVVMHTLTMAHCQTTVTSAMNHSLSTRALQDHDRAKHANPLQYIAPPTSRMSVPTLSNQTSGNSSMVSASFGGGLAGGLAGAFDVGSTSSVLCTESPSYGDLYDQTDLCKYIETELEPDSTSLDNEIAALQSLVIVLQDYLPAEIQPARVILGGSLGKGTAVKGKSDTDLTMMMSWDRYPSVAALKANMGSVLSTLKKQLRRMRHLNVDGLTATSIKVTLTDGLGNKHSVEIRPAVDLAEHETNGTIFWRMRGPDSQIKAFYSASLAPLQVDLVKGLPPKVQGLIRLIKFWNKDKVKPILESRCPTSYVYEIIIMDAWVDARRRDTFVMRRAVFAVLTKLRNHHDLQICTPGIALYNRDDAEIRHRTYIMDPCNPTNDIYNNYDYDWDGVAAEAKKWLEKPVFAGFNINSGWWN